MMRQAMRVTLTPVAWALMVMVVRPGLGAEAPVTLDGLIARAWAENPGLQAAGWRVEAARAALGQARSAWWPRVGLGAGYSLTDNPPQAFMMALNQRALNMADPAFNPNEPDDTDNLRLSATVKHRLLDGGQRGAQVAMARAGGVAAQEQRRAARNALAHEVTRGYYGALQARAFVAVMEQAVASLDESLRVARERLAAGATVQTDVLNLEVQRAQAQEDLIRARNGERLSLAALNTAIGAEAVTAANLVAPATEPAPTVPAEAGDAAALAARPELRAAEAVAHIREADWRRARRERLPVLNAFGSYDLDSPGDSDFEGSYMAGVMAEWELFAGGQRVQAAAQARAEYEAARREADQARNLLRLDLKQARLGLEEAIERTEVARMAAASAEEALRITREQYRRGAVDATLLLTAELGQTATRTRHVAARYDRLVALSNLARARGELAGDATATAR